MVSAESLYGISFILSGNWLCVNISSSELYLMSLRYFLCGCVLHKKRNTNVCPSKYQFQLFRDQGITFFQYLKFTEQRWWTTKSSMTLRGVDC